jgi:hypothetical protein
MISSCPTLEVKPSRQTVLPFCATKSDVDALRFIQKTPPTGVAVKGLPVLCGGAAILNP